MAKRNILPVDRLQKGEEDSWVNVLNAIKTKKIAFVKHQLNFNSKSTAAGNVHLMEPLLDTVDIIHLP